MESDGPFGWGWSAASQASASSLSGGGRDDRCHTGDSSRVVFDDPMLLRRGEGSSFASYRRCLPDDNTHTNMTDVLDDSRATLDVRHSRSAQRLLREMVDGAARAANDEEAAAGVTAGAMGDLSLLTKVVDRGHSDGHSDDGNTGGGGGGGVGGGGAATVSGTADHFKSLLLQFSEVPTVVSTTLLQDHHLEQQHQEQQHRQQQSSARPDDLSLIHI